MTTWSNHQSWFEIDGRLPEIGSKGADIRFPESLVADIISDFSNPGDWVLDPFAGFGTSLHAAVSLGRKAIGFEIVPERAEVAGRALALPNQVITSDAETADLSEIPMCDLLVTSPPYTSIDFDEELWGARYFVVLEEIFCRVATRLKAGAPIVVEVSNIRNEDGFRPLAFQLGLVLGRRFEFRRDLVRCNNNNVPAGPGVAHSHLLVFENRPPRSRAAISFGDWVAS